MRTQLLAVGRWAGRFLLVFIEGIEKVLKENMEWECFRMVVRSIRISM